MGWSIKNWDGTRFTGQGSFIKVLQKFGRLRLCGDGAEYKKAQLGFIEISIGCAVKRESIKSVLQRLV